MNYKDSDQHQRTQENVDHWRNAGMQFGSASIGCGLQIAIVIGAFILIGIIGAIIEAIF